MLETKGLIKVYKPKKGIPVKALDNVSIKFPEKGMVFLLGKSGSGKSTLLNVLGGLDRYDGGEIIIKGTSSRKFRQKHFDSYRNTYVGFIFQEYNVLDEFSVGANIGLALQLQGRKATDEAINRILEEVDLAGYGNRKPNELSGGQKQRVAIARALVKNPEIIMADEPTGALDSVTGKQVLDTLKKLSKEKLVIVVSHDREFAENYADRIIELADGKVISDLEYDSESDGAEESDTLVFDGNTVTIPEKYRLTEEDRKQINDYIEKLEKGEVTLTVSGKKEKTATARRSRPTDESKIQLKDISFKLIKSHLPMRFAFKMGASSLKYKKVRLVFTILLSCVAFTLFGLADTFASYNYVKTGTQSLIDSDISYASFVKTVKYHYGNGENEFYYTEDGHYMSEEDIETIYNRTGIRLKGVYAPLSGSGRIDIDSYLGQEENNNDGFMYYGGGSIYNRFLRGYAELTAEDGVTLVAGKLPEKGTDTVAITTYTLEVFKKYGYISYSDEKPEYKSRYYVEYDWDWETGEEYISGYRDDYGNFYPADEFDMSLLDGYLFDGKNIYYPPEEEPVDNTVTITKAEDMLGKELLGKTVVGIVDAGVDITRYEHIYDTSLIQSTADTILNFALREEFENLISYSFANVLIVPEGFIEKELASAKGTYFSQGGGDVMDSTSGFYLTSLSVIKDAAYLDENSYVRLDGTKSPLADDEILLDFNMLRDSYAYGSGYTWDEDGNVVSEWDYSEIIVTASELMQKGIEPATDEALLYAVLTNRPVTVTVNTWGKLGEMPESVSLKVVGFVRSEEYGLVCLNETNAKRFATEIDGEFIFAATAMPESYDQIQSLVALSDEDTEIRFEMKNPVLYELGTLRDAFDILAPIFLWIGVGFAVFASLMMSNFITTSISHKKREIGILRAIGSRSNDVFRIFFSESFIIAMINFVLTTFGVFAITVIANTAIRSSTGLLITVLSFGARQVILEFAVALIVAAVASFLPVKRIASKKPIDAIRDR